MSFINKVTVINLLCKCVRCNLTRIQSKTHCTAQIFNVTLFRHKVDYRVSCVRVKFRWICVLVAKYVSCVFYNRNLHTKTNSKIRNFVFSCILSGNNLTFNTSVTKTARYKNTVRIFKKFIHSLCSNFFTVYPLDINVWVILYSAVL